jgi:hypothetical protein
MVVLGGVAFLMSEVPLSRSRANSTRMPRFRFGDPGVETGVDPQKAP